jgi:hypothetical protein
VESERKLWTVYDGPGGRQLMRSRTEAFTAAWLDLHRIRWVYEPKRFGKTGWLPDFWLPDTRLLIDVKGGDITPEDRKMIRESAYALRGGTNECPVAVCIWKPKGSDAWQRVMPDESRFRMKPFEAFLCAKCGLWTLGWYLCQTCEIDTGFVLEHTGRNFVRDPATFFGERDCELAIQFFKAASARIKRVEDLPDTLNIKPCGLPGEESQHFVQDVSIYGNQNHGEAIETDEDIIIYEEEDEDDEHGGEIPQVYYVKVELPDVTECL